MPWPLQHLTQRLVTHTRASKLTTSTALSTLHYLRIIAEECNQADGWPGVETIRQLATTTCRFIQEGGPFAANQLRAVLKDSSSIDSSSANDSSSSDSSTDKHFEILPEQRLDSIYLTVLRSPYTLIREIVRAIVLLQLPLSTSSLAQLLRVPIEDVHRTLYKLHSIVEKTSTHQRLASRCLELISTPGGLRQDMCNLLDPGVLQREIDEETISRNLPPELEYACRYWVDHLECSERSIEDGDATHCFLEKHLLHWLEAMSLLNETSLCVRLLARLQALAMAPLQIYSLALLFSPESSSVVRVISGRDAEWDVCWSVLEGHSNLVRVVVFSPDGQLVALASDDSTVRVWETATGQCRSVLEGHSYVVSAVVFSPDGQLEIAMGHYRSVLDGHSHMVSAVVFSPDGQLVASASADSTVRV
ncbi:platelet-activating factor acetylhydrolase IB subunit alpha [Bipolaris maydis]|nr:platelet-activating factor acetylhydrolase IB subunit alpha [Bipolaris maydis]